MKLCPKCKIPIKERTKVAQDRLTNKRWMITYCDKCHFNFDLEPATGEVSPKEILDIMDIPAIPLWENGKFIQ